MKYIRVDHTIFFQVAINLNSFIDELNLEETETSLTLGGSWEGRVQVRGKGRGRRCCSVVRFT
jgi:hypothetical protein